MSCAARAHGLKLCNARIKLRISTVVVLVASGYIDYRAASSQDHHTQHALRSGCRMIVQQMGHYDQLRRAHSRRPGPRAQGLGFNVETRICLKWQVLRHRNRC